MQWLKAKFVLFFSLFFLLLNTGCQTTGGGLRLDMGAYPAPAPKAGPPSHAPAHGERRKHHYYYYPESSVYFDIQRKLYFYLSGSSWTFSASLPTRLRTQLTEHVEFDMDSDKPYLEYQQHRKHYPPGQYKKKDKHKDKKKNKGNKWQE